LCRPPCCWWPRHDDELVTKAHDSIEDLGVRFDAKHFADIEGLLARHAQALDGYLARSIESLAPE
jgi:hypothetical protein